MGFVDQLLIVCKSATGTLRKKKKIELITESEIIQKSRILKKKLLE